MNISSEAELLRAGSRLFRLFAAVMLAGSSTLLAGRGDSLGRCEPGSSGSADEGATYRQRKDGLGSTDMSWLLLVVAGLLEVAWASVLPLTAGLTRAVPTVWFLVLLAGSMITLAKAAETIPLGTAYAVWVGIGAVGAATVGIVARGDPASLGRIAFLALLVVAIVGLEVTSSH